MHGARGGGRGDRGVHRRVALNPPDPVDEENRKTLSYLRHSSQLQVFTVILIKFITSIYF